MAHLANSQHNDSVSVSLWQGTELLGWFRARDIDDTGMLVTGPIAALTDDSVVTVTIEFNHQEVINTLSVKALVVHSPTQGKALWWVNQQANVGPSNADSTLQYALPCSVLIRSLGKLQ